MKEFLLFVIGGALIVGLFFGFITIVQKTMHNHPTTEPVKTPDTDDSKAREKKQKKTAEEIREEQKRLMQQREDMMRSNRNRR